MPLSRSWLELSSLGVHRRTFAHYRLYLHVLYPWRRTNVLIANIDKLVCITWSCRTPLRKKTSAVSRVRVSRMTRKYFVCLQMSFCAQEGNVQLLGCRKNEKIYEHILGDAKGTLPQTRGAGKWQSNDLILSHRIILSVSGIFFWHCMLPNLHTPYRGKNICDIILNESF